jgi:hypothetical protein
MQFLTPNRRGILMRARAPTDPVIVRVVPDHEHPVALGMTGDQAPAASWRSGHQATGQGSAAGSGAQFVYTDSPARTPFASLPNARLGWFRSSSEFVLIYGKPRIDGHALDLPACRKRWD